ncbi:MAG: alkaline phosphatase family protein, partial [Chitinophagales bacterium]
QKFNEKKYADTFMAADWNLFLPAEKYQSSTADNVPWEYTHAGETEPVFPHRTSLAANMESIKATPFGNTFTTLFAKEVIRNENLGADTITDILCVSYSSPDYIGHAYGPHSMEIEDTYIRLDRDIADLLQFLDAEIGKGAYLVFLSSDHGVAPAAGYMQALDIPSGLINEQSFTMEMDSVLKSIFGPGDYIESYSNQQVYLNHSVLQQKKITVAQVHAALFAAFIQKKGVANIINLQQLHAALIPDVYNYLVLNGISAKRSGDLQILYEPNWMEYGLTGSTHGAHYSYDTHVPLLWYGWEVPNGKTWRKTEVTDIAPTIAALLRIKAPNGSIGEIVEEILHP